MEEIKDGGFIYIFLFLVFGFGFIALFIITVGSLGLLYGGGITIKNYVQSIKNNVSFENTT